MEIMEEHSQAEDGVINSLNWIVHKLFFELFFELFFVNKTLSARRPPERGCSGK